MEPTETKTETPTPTVVINQTKSPGVLDKLSTANIICFLVFAVLAAITIIAMVKNMDIINQLIVAWIAAASAVTGYLFGRQQNKTQ